MESRYKQVYISNLEAGIESPEPKLLSVVWTIENEKGSSATKEQYSRTASTAKFTDTLKKKQKFKFSSNKDAYNPTISKLTLLCGNETIGEYRFDLSL